MYLESPAGVGFSYSDDKSYATNDTEVSPVPARMPQPSPVGVMWERKSIALGSLCGSVTGYLR